MVNRKERQELNELSKTVFGSSSRWQKLVDKGYEELVTEEKTETIPAAKEGEETKTNTYTAPVLTHYGAKQYTIKYHTAESVKEFMLERLKQQEEIKQMIEKNKAEEKARKEALIIQDTAAGSAKVSSA